MKIIYAREKFPKSFKKAVFLAGPSPRGMAGVESWRLQAIRLLKEMGYNGLVFSPEPRKRNPKLKYDDKMYDDQIKWETEGLNKADCIIFWIPRTLDKMPGFTTNIEYGEWFKSGKIVLGAPKNASKLNYLRARGADYNVPMYYTLRNTIKKALKMVGRGALRRDGECDVPLHIWKTETFQSWYKAQRLAGNKLDKARVEWTFRPDGKKGFLFLWVLKVSVFIGREKRYKTNEFVIARPDISTMLLFKKGKNIEDTVVVLIREFRSPVANSDGSIWELPSGSAFHLKKNPLVSAANELREETGLRINPERIKLADSRQLMGTLSAHKSHLYYAEITMDELAWLVKQSGIPRGIKKDSERTFVELKTVKQILKERLVDWSMLGMILSVLTKEFN